MSRTETRGNPKVRRGVVVSDKMDKTVVVEVEYMQRHPLYKKRMRRTQKFMAHDENNECREGDRVDMVETRPRSKRKRWRVRRIVDRAK